VPDGLREETRQALLQAAVPVEWVRLDRSDPFGYGRMLRRLWRQERTFVICEQDVVPTVSQLWEIVSCGHLWCSYGYDDGNYPEGPMFGLCRFDWRLMHMWPAAAEISTIIGSRRDYEAEWWRVDSLLARDLQIRQVPWVKHLPPVRHIHPGGPGPEG
jgi:hypothetical protein